MECIVLGCVVWINRSRDAQIPVELIIHSS